MASTATPLSRGSSSGSGSQGRTNRFALPQPGPPQRPIQGGPKTGRSSTCESDGLATGDGVGPVGVAPGGEVPGAEAPGDETPGDGDAEPGATGPGLVATPAGVLGGSARQYRIRPGWPLPGLDGTSSTGGVGASRPCIVTTLMPDSPGNRSMRPVRTSMTRAPFWPCSMTEFGVRQTSVRAAVWPAAVVASGCSRPVARSTISRPVSLVRATRVPSGDSEVVCSRAPPSTLS